MKRKIRESNGALYISLSNPLGGELSKGGSGSGNFGHSGRAGVRGGSGGGGGGGGGGGTGKPPAQEQVMEEKGTGNAIVGYSDVDEYTNDQLVEEWYTNIDSDDRADYIEVIEAEMKARGVSDPMSYVDQFDLSDLDEE